MFETPGGASIEPIHANRWGIFGLFAWVVSILFGCSPPPDVIPPELQHTADDLLATPTRTILSQSSALGLPQRALVVGNHLVVLDLALPPAFHILNRYDGAYLRAAGQRGAGPGEFVSPIAIFNVPGDDSLFFAFDGALERATIVDLRKPLNIASQPGYIFGFAGNSSVISPVRVASGEFLALGHFTDGRLGRFDDRGVFLGSVGPLPDGPVGVDAILRQYANQGQISAAPDGGRVVVATRFASRIEVVDPINLSMQTGSGPVEVIPDYRPGTRSMLAWSRETRYAYMSVSATNTTVVALFSGRSVKETREKRNSGRYIHIFDWDARFLTAFQLENDAVAVAVDPGGNNLYAVEQNPVPLVAVYDISQLAESIAHTHR